VSIEDSIIDRLLELAMFQTIQPHKTQILDRSNISLSICYSRALIRSALQLKEIAAATIEADLILCGCVKEYLQRTGQKIDRLEQWEMDLIGTYYQQISQNIAPDVNFRLHQIGIAIRAYIDLNLKN
jgi:hypothetical protein